MAAAPLWSDISLCCEWRWAATYNRRAWGRHVCFAVAVVQRGHSSCACARLFGWPLSGRVRNNVISEVDTQPWSSEEVAACLHVFVSTFPSFDQAVFGQYSFAWTALFTSLAFPWSTVIQCVNTDTRCQSQGLPGSPHTCSKDYQHLHQEQQSLHIGQPVTAAHTTKHCLSGLGTQHNNTARRPPHPCQLHAGSCSKHTCSTPPAAALTCNDMIRQQPAPAQRYHTVLSTHTHTPLCSSKSPPADQLAP